MPASSEATRALSRRAGVILDVLDNHFRLAGDLVADLGDGAAGRGL